MGGHNQGSNISLFCSFSKYIMETRKHVYREDEEIGFVYLVEYPGYITQGETLEELKENLKDI